MSNTTCPHCGHQNIEGVDECEECQQSLDFLSNRQPNSDIERSLVRDRLRLLGPKTPYVVSPKTTVGEVLNLLVEQSIGCVLIVENEKLLGIFSERDVLIRLNVDAALQLARPVSDFMTPKPETLEADDKIAFALHKMDIGGYRHLPVLEKGKPTGIISIRDILRYITDDLLETQEV